MWSGARLNGNKMSASMKVKELSCSVHVCVGARARLCVLVRVCACVFVCVCGIRSSVTVQKRD